MTRQTENILIALIVFMSGSALVATAMWKRGEISTDLMYVTSAGVGVAVFVIGAVNLLPRISPCSRIQAALGASLTLCVPFILMMAGSR